MFSKKEMKVVDWWLFFLLMAIPLVNVIFFIIILLSGDTNKCLKNYMWALILPVILVLVLLFSTGIFAAVLDVL